jgi:predicted dinucleotide-binding enzyme
MKIGILGSGVVGQALANGFIKLGYEVMVGTRSLEKLSEWKEKAGEKGHVGSFAETATFDNIITLAVKGTAAIDTLKMAGAEKLKGITIIDATNPIADEPPENGVLKFFTSIENLSWRNYSLPFLMRTS